MSGPRAVFTSTAPGFIRAKAAASMRPRVAGVSGACTEMASERANSVSRLTASTPQEANTSLAA